MPRTVLAPSLLLVLSTIASAQSGTGVPRLISMSGVIADQSGKVLNGNYKIAFSVYTDANAPAPIWSETQKLAVSDGRYDVILGAATSNGVPSDVFAGGQARWLGVRIDKGAEAPRTLLTSLPYALAADDATRLGGHDASEFVLKNTPSAASIDVSAAAAPTSSGTPNGWKLAVAEEASTRASADTTLTTNLADETSLREAADTTLTTDLAKEQVARETATTTLTTNLATERTAREAADTTLTTNLTNEKSARETADAAATSRTDELGVKLESAKNDLQIKIAVETTKVKTDVTAEQAAKLTALEQKLTGKAQEIDLKKVDTEAFEVERQQKNQALSRKVDTDAFELERQTRINLLKEKLDTVSFGFELDNHQVAKKTDLEAKLDTAAFSAAFGTVAQKNDLDRKLDFEAFQIERTLKDTAIGNLEARKLETTKYEADKAELNGQLDGVKSDVDAVKTRFAVAFSRTPNRGQPAATDKLCPGQTIVTGIAAFAATLASSTSPSCQGVAGATIRADGLIGGIVSGAPEVVGLGGGTPDFQLTCPAGYAVVGVTVGEQTAIRCRQLFGTIEVTVPDDAAAPSSCPAGQVVTGLDTSAGVQKICG